MSRELFARSAAELLAAIGVCMGAKLTVPTLILVYSAIDIAGWLDADERAPGSVKSRFTGWVERYLLPAKALPCTALELYAARCGVVHSYSPGSDLTDKGASRKVIYAWGDSRTDMLQQMIDVAQITGWVPVQLEDLIEGYQIGMEAFTADLAGQPERAAAVYARAGKFFGPMSKEQGLELLRWAREVLGQA